jgi:hypothetical protein
MTLNHKIIFTIVTIALLFSNIQTQDISENSLIVLTAQKYLLLYLATKQF